MSGIEDVATLLTLLVWLVKTAFYAATLLAAGLGLHRVAGIKRGVRSRLVLVLAVVGAVLMAVRLLLANARLGGGLDTMLDTGTFSWVWAAHGTTALLVWAGMALLAIFARFPYRPLALAGAVLAALSYSFSGHTQALETPGIFPWLAGLHVLIAAFWIAAPVSLIPETGPGSAALRERMETFSGLAMMLVPVLFLGGVWLAPVIAGGVDKVLTTAYGRFLILKLALATVALGLGALNKYRITGKLADSPVEGQKLLKRTLTMEALVFTGILATIAWITVASGPEG